MIVQAQRPGTLAAGQDQGIALCAQVVLLTALGVGPAGWLAGAAYGVALWLVLTQALRRSGTYLLGPADRVTLARATLAGGVLALVVSGVDGPLLVGVASVALLLDAVDGQVARRTGTVSALGARFDMEVDAFLILVLSVEVSLSAGWWVLAIGAMRYAFVAAARFAPWLGADLPPSRARKIVAAMQGVLLVVAGILPATAAIAVAAVALASLVWSFGRDIGRLWRRRVS
ncbi:CDP-alcohol phosphatidyltransferase family protein [Amycolatopsis sp. K13G38]|uniref:CDP-alcohol phosphatidyltransferase family protein n=1 Tax=Amycolatopsis acididurans TaxID=2724524 RepID=A0ABX1J4A9_9PSEU|nr:CDP-alcohol phosphatidyltransferase family protein [Amycolatopsis acididurans]NKQ54645.1 CDP-alcohol phosphatidyltransferase family protein [Amycolatopsis acididurans]